MLPDTAPVSIVIPVLNESAMLPALLSALADQAVGPGEFIFVDAGSSDDSVALIRDWWQRKAAPGRVLIVLEKAGAFPGGARNAGIARATQPWIAFLDVGVTPERDWLRALIDAASSDGTAGIFGVTTFSGRDALTTALCSLSYGQGATRPTLPASMFRREVFDRVGPFDPALRAGEDVLWLRKFRQAWPDALTETKARAVYTHFPGSLSAAAGKWFEYERHVVRARINGNRPYFHAAVLIGIIAAFASSATAVLALLLVYLLARGVADPIRRSARWNWWREYPASFLLAAPCAVVIDAARIAGGVKGILERKRA